MNKTVAIIGRPNVGKSTLFNRIVGRRRALVHHVPGTTRDINEVQVSWKGQEFMLVDTGGWGDDGDPDFTVEIKKVMAGAVELADVVVFLVDGKDGFHPLDKELNNILRRSKKNTVLVVNKIDTQKDETKLLDFYRMGITDIIPVSSTHGRNVYEVLDKVFDYLGKVEVSSKSSKPKENSINVTLLGKPNVGKSSLFNKLYKKERNIVTDKPGTTREAIDISIKRDGQKFLLIDTPGLHKKRKFKSDLDYLSALSARRALERTDVAVLLMDASLPVGETETKIAEQILKSNCACLLAINKWDLIDDREKQIKEISRQLEKKLHFLWWSKLIYVSAKTGQRTEKILDEVKTIHSEFSKYVPGDKLKEVILNALHKRPIGKRGHALKVKSVTQSGNCPPTFSFIVNDPEIIHFSHRRFIENTLRREFDFCGTPILLRFQQRAPRESTKVGTTGT